MLNAERERETIMKAKAKGELSKGKLICLIIAVCSLIILSFFIREIARFHHENYLDMRTVVGYSATETGLHLYTDDGNGYYWEMDEN